ncbi:STRN1_3_4 [Lepeophtheirus salmonis]|uniref:STRN1_3_4 n=1 Tax=Lepeophtheirus salmonis TaxID=72036 RepID=A0A7R8CXC5_LEPSM|nr:STRN1_3_4 [Lepeophtheirus salmonis]CAF2959949.1 STRN1_3_4 [Lepeophtheirus salmonis]
MMDHQGSSNNGGESVLLKEDINSSGPQSPTCSSGVGGMSPSPGSAPCSGAQVQSVPSQQGQRVNYSIPGILHFIQHEWSRFEMERNQWEEERAELQTRVAFLQGERKGQENLKKDLVRRIKMLEYALKQERNKYQRLKKSQNNPDGVAEDPEDSSKLGLEEGDTELDDNDLLTSKLDIPENYVAVSNVNWRQGKQLLRQYLQEIGYTDTIIDVRANRVRSVLGLDVNRINNGPPPPNPNNPPSRQPNAATHLNPEKEESVVMANFDFLSQEVDAEDDEEENTPEESNTKVEAEVTHEDRRKIGEPYDASADNRKWNSGSSSNSYSRFTGSRPGVSIAPPSSQGSESLKNPDKKLVGSNLELGELEQLAVINDNELSCDFTTPKEALRKNVERKIYASEDQTLKMWNLQKTTPVKKSTAFDVEPVYTFRAHRGPVLSLDVSRAGDLIFSGGIDASIRVWNMPSPDIDPYNLYDPSVLASSLFGHSDAVWGLAYNNLKQQLLSCSADGTVKLWSPLAKVPLLRTFGKPVIKLDTQGNDVGAITRVACKLTHSMVAHLEAVTSIAIDANGLYLISGSHDRSVRLWNIETKTCVQEITAHRKNKCRSRCLSQGLRIK